MTKTFLVNPRDGSSGRRWSSQGMMAGALSVAGLGMLLVTGLALRTDRSAHWNLCIALVILSGFIAIVATRIAAKVPARIGLTIVISFAIVLRIAALSEPPMFSGDVYRYVWDGRVQAAGINPYRYVPADEALAGLRDAAVFPKIERAGDAHTIYPPVAQFFFAAVARLGDSTMAMRLALIGCDIAILIILIDLLRALGKPPALAVAYAWHPLAIWEIANNGHVEALMVALVMIGMWLLARRRRFAAGIAIALAVLVKPYAAVALPACWRPWDWRLPVAVIAVATACYLPYVGVGTGVFGYLPGYLTEEGYRDGQGFWLVVVARTIFGNVPGLVPLYLALAATSLGYFALRAAFRPCGSPAARLGDVASLLLCALFFLSPNNPWYYLVLVPLIPVCGAPAWVLSISGFTLYLDYANSDMIDIVWKGVFNLAFLIALLTPRLRAGISKR
jgi:hypothetical protein